jgi:hypothetical protein
MFESYEGKLTNVAFKHLVLSWRPDGVVGFFPTQEGQDLTQTVCRLGRCSDPGADQ